MPGYRPASLRELAYKLWSNRSRNGKVGGASVRLDLLRGNQRISVLIIAPPLCEVRNELVPRDDIDANTDGRIVQFQGKLVI